MVENGRPQSDGGGTAPVTAADVPVPTHPAPTHPAPTHPEPTHPVRTARPRAADLRAQLDEKAAATDELREALDELRHVLDVDQTPPANRAGRRRGPILLVAVVAVALLGLVVALWGQAGGSPGGSITTPAASVPAAADTNGPPSTRALPSVPVRPLPWPGGAVTVPPGLAPSGPGADVPGADVLAAVDPDGQHVDVFERLVTPVARTGPLELRLPALPAAVSRATVVDLQVELDGVGVPVTSAAPGVWRASTVTGAPWTRAVVRFRMADGVAVVSPAAAGRAFAVVPSLTGADALAAGLPVRVGSAGTDVDGVTCPSAPAIGQVCGSRSGPAWTATLPAGTTAAVVVLQVTLPR